MLVRTLRGRSVRRHPPPQLFEPAERHTDFRAACSFRVSAVGADEDDKLPAVMRDVEWPRSTSRQYLV